MISSTQTQEAVSFFFSTITELMVLFVLVSFIVSIVNAYLPTDKVRQLLSGNRGYTTAISLGAVTPFCSCSTIPMLIGLLKARAQFGPVMAFLFISPLINPFIVSLFWLTFGAQITLLYSVFAIAMAIIAGLLLQHLNFEQFIKQDVFSENKSCQQSSCTDNDNETASDATPASCCTKKARVKKAHVLKQLVKETFSQLKTMLPYMLLGVAVGAAMLLVGQACQK